MKKLLLIICLFISANAFAQDTNEFFVKNNGDTVYCKINGIDEDQIDYTIDNQKDLVSLKNVIGYKLKKGYYLIKKVIHEDVSNDISFKRALYRIEDSTYYYFLPNNTGKYVVNMFSKETYVINSGNLRFYKEVLPINGGYTSGAYNLYFIEKEDSNVLINIPAACLFCKKDTTAWAILEQYCSDNPKAAKAIDKSRKKNIKNTYPNIEYVISQYCGTSFMALSKVKK